jgi:hypothetical protein
MRAIGRWWRKKQREIDMALVWPRCLSYAGKHSDRWRGTVYTPIDLARVQFSMHVLYDDAWTKDFTRSEIEEFVDRLRPGDREPLLIGRRDEGKKGGGDP